MSTSMCSLCRFEAKLFELFAGHPERYESGHERFGIWKKDNSAACAYKYITNSGAPIASFHFVLRSLLDCKEQLQIEKREPGNQRRAHPAIRYGGMLDPKICRHIVYTNNFADEEQGLHA